MKIFLIYFIFNFSYAFAINNCPLEFIRFSNDPQSKMTATISTLTIVWHEMDDNEMDLKFEEREKCKIEGGNFLVSAYYAKSEKIILLIKDEGASHNIQHATFYSAKTCKPVFKDKEVYGEWGLVDNRLEAKAYCTSTEDEFFCSPAQIYDLDKNCRPIKNEAMSLKATKETLGHELRSYKKFKNEKDPLFVKMMNQLKKAKKPSYERYY